MGQAAAWHSSDLVRQRVACEPEQWLHQALKPESPRAGKAAPTDHFGCFVSSFTVVPTVWTRVLALVGFVLVGCREQPDAAPVEPLPRMPLADPVLRGVSGVALIPNSGEPLQYLVVPERGRHIVPIVLSGSAGEHVQLRSGPAMAMNGVPEGLDTESLAFFRPESDPTQIVLGTEAHTPRKSDALLLGEMAPGAFEVRRVVELDYGAWSMEAEDNHGLEGICAVEGRIVTVCETLHPDQSRRWAPVAVYDVDEDEWAYHRVALRTSDGTISGLSCAKGERGRIVVSAIERHYDTMRLVRFVLGESPDVEAEELVNLAPSIGGDTPNLEGLAPAGDGFLLLTDNDNGGVSGTTEAILWRPAARAER